MFSSVVVPLDGSPASEAVLPLVRDLVAATRARVHLVRAVQDPVVAAFAAFDTGVVPVPAMPEVPTQQEVLKEAADYLRAAAARVGEGADVRVDARIGNAAAVICAAVAETGAGAVVMATHGRTALGALVLGSVANEVLRRAGVPVLLIRPDRSMLSAPVAGGGQG